MTTIGHISVLNCGGFAASISLLYMGADGVQQEVRCSESFVTSRTATASPKNADIPDGAIVQLRVNVIGGLSNLGSERFVYSACSGAVADYVISGTSLVNRLDYKGIRYVGADLPPPCIQPDPRG